MKKIQILDAKKFDSDGVLVLENVNYQQYINKEVSIRFDKEEILAVLKVCVVYIVGNFFKLII